MDDKKLTAKLGNWQETIAMQRMMDGQVYDPRVKSTGALTKIRVITHSDNVESKDYKSTLNSSGAPQAHRDYVTDDGKGPRQRRMEAQIHSQVSAEEKQRESAIDSKNNERLMVTTTGTDFNGSNFANTKLGSNPNAVKRRDPYYVKDAAITYYLHTALHGDNFDFPATSIGSLDKLWLRGSSFTEGTNPNLGKKSETHENSSVPPTVRELQVLKKLRFDVVTACGKTSPSTAKGGTVQTLTQKILDLDSAAGRAPVEDIARVLALYTGIELSVPQQDAVVIAFSRMNDERIILIEFIEYIRGGMSVRAKDLVFRVWEAACSSHGQEYVTERDVAAAMIGSADKEVMNTILDSLHLYSCGREVGYDVVDLLEYYRDVYAELGDDDDFEDTLRATWNV